ncbi:MAG: lysophospholipid acyltransferase family protein [Kiritimatiellia bacterium]
MAYRTKHLIEYAFLRAMVVMLALLPLRAALVAGWLLAALTTPFSGKRLREARRRIREVMGPDVPESTLKKWARASWRNLCFNVVEVARAGRRPVDEITRQVDCPEINKLLDLRQREGGYVLAVSHMGNWDLAGFAVRQFGLPIFALARAQSNPLVTRYLDRTRDRFRVEAMERGRSLGSVVKRIKAGGVFSILPDIRAKSRDASIRVPYLGREAFLTGGMALFARLAGKPIVTVIVRREGWSRHVWEVQDPVYPDENIDRDEDILRMTTEVMARFDRAVREYPDQYFWFNKRWVLDDRF